jgi:hypothetical protein
LTALTGEWVSYQTFRSADPGHVWSYNSSAHVLSRKWNIVPSKVILQVLMFRHEKIGIVFLGTRVYRPRNLIPHQPTLTVSNDTLLCPFWDGNNYANAVSFPESDGIPY